MSIVKPFQPTPGSTNSISVSTSSANANIPEAGESILLTNSGSTLAYVRTGQGSSTAATTADMPLAAGASRIITRSANHDYVAAITASSTTTLLVTAGTGS